ncbi:hypothetical protein QUF80_20675 [Desulfococcaceae bacterium HSG8]|nr:hypothetical protein [Desulfococcaceae bacterium HSG8]
MEKKRYLIVADVPGIKEYVFGTDRLVEIRGASALLDKLNRRETEPFLKKRLGNSAVEPVFSNGGAGQFVITAEKTDLEKCILELKGFFAEQSKGGLRLICGIAELSEDNYADVLALAHIGLKKEKEEKTIAPCTQLHTGYMQECRSCSSGMASQSYVYGDEERLLCPACVKKCEYGKKRGLWKEFAEYCDKKKGVEAKRPRTFEEIGDRCRARKGYTALIYADGNAMGKLVKKIRTIEHFKFFSDTVDTSVREACHESLYTNCKPVKDKIPANILLLGGDDLMVYLSADTAFPFALDAARIFEEKTKEKFAGNSFFSELLEGEGLTISLGIAYGKSHTPFPIMFSQSEELLKSAKKAGSQDEKRGEYYAPAYIDFHLSSSYNQIKVSDSRKNHLLLHGATDVKLYQKPYSLTDARVLMEHARNLIEAGIPNTRLKRFGYAPSLGKNNGSLECIKLYARSGIEQRLVIRDALKRFGCLRDIPWKKPEQEKGDNKHKDKEDPHTTVLSDIIELVGFMRKGSINRKGESHAP